MVFKRRERRSRLRVVAEFFYPRGGWRRAASYMGHRLSRLPDSPDRIARGIAAGMFASCTPFYGMHFVIAALAARTIRGNILAALLGTFLGNPITFPLIVESSVQLGSWILGLGAGLHFPQVMTAFGLAWAEIWTNLYQLVTGGEPNWFRLRLFFGRVFLPYLLGGVIIGILTGILVYYVSLPLIRAYQNSRRNRLRARFEASRRAAAAAAAGLDPAPSVPPSADADAPAGNADPAAPDLPDRAPGAAAPSAVAPAASNPSAGAPPPPASAAFPPAVGGIAGAPGRDDAGALPR